MILRLWCAFVCLALLLPSSPAQSQDVSAETRAEFVEPIITEETLPNEPGEWDLRISCAYAPNRADISADCLRTQLFFGIAPRWGLELEDALTNISGDRPEEARARLGAALKYLLRKPTVHGPALVFALESGFAVGRPQASEEGRVELQPTFAFLQSLGRTTASAASRLEEICRARDHFQLGEAVAALESEIAVLIPELDACLVDAQP